MEMPAGSVNTAEFSPRDTLRTDVVLFHELALTHTTIVASGYYELYSLLPGHDVDGRNVEQASTGKGGKSKDLYPVAERTVISWNA